MDLRRPVPRPACPRPSRQSVAAANAWRGWRRSGCSAAGRDDGLDRGASCAMSLPHPQWSAFQISVPDKMNFSPTAAGRYRRTANASPLPRLPQQSARQQVALRSSPECSSLRRRSQPRVLAPLSVLVARRTADRILLQEGPSRKWIFRGDRPSPSVAPAKPLYGGTWNRDGVILSTNGTGLACTVSRRPGATRSRFGHWRRAKLLRYGPSFCPMESTTCICPWQRAVSTRASTLPRSTQMSASSS
jgi:hypothetical protein